MNFYQVNQKDSFALEFHGGYLCAPDGPRGNWQSLQDLQIGDLVFHYNSPRQSVLGISRVISPGKHKGAGTDAHTIPGSCCIRYRGFHLSEGGFKPDVREGFRKRYPTYLEVHTEALLERNLGKLLGNIPLVYLISVAPDIAVRFLAKNNIELESLITLPVKK